MDLSSSELPPFKMLTDDDVLHHTLFVTKICFALLCLIIIGYLIYSYWKRNDENNMSSIDEEAEEEEEEEPLNIDEATYEMVIIMHKDRSIHIV